MGRAQKKQAKHAKKVLGFYRQAFGLERPYQLIRAPPPAPAPARRLKRFSAD